MKTWTKKTKNREIGISYDGMHYVFNDSFSGVFAIATRTKGYQFELLFGNSCNYSEIDNANDRDFAKEFITKCETQLVKNEIIFTEVLCNCDEKFFITLNIQSR